MDNNYDNHSLWQNQLTSSASQFAIYTKIVTNKPGSYPTIASYNASAVKIYNASSSPLRFENKNIFSFTKKNALAY
jgi:hypothetical protein